MSFLATASPPPPTPRSTHSGRSSASVCNLAHGAGCELSCTIKSKGQQPLRTSHPPPGDPGYSWQLRKLPFSGSSSFSKPGRKGLHPQTLSDTEQVPEGWLSLSLPEDPEARGGPWQELPGGWHGERGIGHQGRQGAYPRHGHAWESWVVRGVSTQRGVGSPGARPQIRGSLSAAWATKRVPRKGSFLPYPGWIPFKNTKAIRYRGPSQHFLFRAGLSWPQEGWADLARRWSG